MEKSFCKFLTLVLKKLEDFLITKRKTALANQFFIYLIIQSPSTALILHSSKIYTNKKNAVCVYVSLSAMVSQTYLTNKAENLC